MQRVKKQVKITWGVLSSIDTGLGLLGLTLPPLLVVTGGLIMAFFELSTWFPLVAFVLLCTIVFGTYGGILGYRLRMRQELHEEIEKAYKLVQRVHRPGILDPAAPGNRDFMAEQAQDAIDVLRPKLLAEEPNPPGMIDINNKDSVAEWYDYLRIRRTKD